MVSITSEYDLYLYTGRVDMRKGFDRLCGIVSEEMGHNPRKHIQLIFRNFMLGKTKNMRAEQQLKLAYMTIADLKNQNEKLDNAVPALSTIVESIRKLNQIIVYG